MFAFNPRDFRKIACGKPLDIGQPIGDVCNMLKGTASQIPKNLHNALKRLRSRGHPDFKFIYCFEKEFAQHVYRSRLRTSLRAVDWCSGAESRVSISVITGWPVSVET